MAVLIILEPAAPNALTVTVHFIATVPPTAIGVVDTKSIPATKPAAVIVGAPAVVELHVGAFNNVVSPAK